MHNICDRLAFLSSWWGFVDFGCTSGAFIFVTYWFFTPFFFRCTRWVWHHTSSLNLNIGMGCMTLSCGIWQYQGRGQDITFGGWELSPGHGERRSVSLYRGSGGTATSGSPVGVRGRSPPPWSWKLCSILSSGGGAKFDTSENKFCIMKKSFSSTPSITFLWGGSLQIFFSLHSFAKSNFFGTSRTHGLFGGRPAI